MAVEPTGPEAARSYVEAAGLTFPTIIDEQGALSRFFDFKVVPNGVLLDEDGTIRWAKFGGFSIDNPDDVAVVERFLAGEEPGPTPVQDAPYALGPLERELVMTKLQMRSFERRLLNAPNMFSAARKPRWPTAPSTVSITSSSTKA